MKKRADSNMALAPYKRSMFDYSYIWYKCECVILWSRTKGGVGAISGVMNWIREDIV